MIKAKLSILFVFLFIVKGFSQTSDWKFIKKVDGITIYHRNSGIGNLKDVKIETTFDCNLSTVTEALLDVSAFTKWIYKVEYAKTLKVHNPNHVEYYEKINMPWPAQDRDVVVINKVKQHKETKEVVSEDNCNWTGLPVSKDYVRIKEFYAKWVFQPTASGVKGTYIFHSDPGGDLPSAVVNMFINEGPVNSIKGLKALVKLDKYKNSNSHNIIN
ncbi:hypothetical protein EGI22_08120 [Lacihabitans sp. LS3-19]|uniref:START domain-containing protein n=1 Tax=Lacihabitans sp. LS3-19 TaxID=2487335 RepID=UPI0020CFC7AB|nr:START domain-containing protein [Lacihabitans sp. LS3-19]MCP9767876.1 hypothetical protein [Lacihabitans sp. LS3-19]